MIPEEQARLLKPQVAYFWKLVAENQWGATASPSPARQFTIDPALPPLTDDMLTEYGENADGVVVQAGLRGKPDPAYGTLLAATGWKPRRPGRRVSRTRRWNSTARTACSSTSCARFRRPSTRVALRFSAQRVAGPLGQVLSAWCRGMDDPLRISVHEGKLYARIEAGAGYSTSGMPIEKDVWYDVCVVKRSSELTLFVDGKLVETIRVPAIVQSAARDFALGGNPHFTGSSEHLPCRVADLVLIARPLSPEEVATLHESRGK